MSARFGRRPWLTSNLVVLSWVSLFQDTASELLYPILPIFLTGVLGAPVAVVAITEGLADGASSLTKIVSGRMADRRSRRGLIGLGYGMAAAAKVIIATAFVWPMVLGARVFDRIGKGVRGAPRDALIADVTPAEFRGRAFGFHRAIDTTGAVIGPLLGLVLYEALNHRLRPLLIVAAIPAIFSVMLVRLVVDPRSSTPPTESPNAESPNADGPAADGPAASALPARFWRVVLPLTAFSVVNFSDALLLLRARSLGLSVTAVIGVYCAYNAVYALLSYPAGAISDCIPRRIVFSAGLIVFAVAYIGLGLATSPVTVWVLFIVYGAFTALTDGVSRAWVADLVPAAVRGRALGLQQGLGGGATIVAGIWAGLAWNDTGRVPLIISGVAAAVIAVALLSTGRVLDHPVLHRFDQGSRRLSRIEAAATAARP